MNRKQKGSKAPVNGKKIKRLKFYLALFLTAVMTLAGPFYPVHAPVGQPVWAEEQIVSDPKGFARNLARNQHGWNQQEQKCLGKLWGKESAWNHRAVSPTRDYGIPQRHMSKNTRKQIAQFLNNPETQIIWGLQYIEHRYGSPCQAWEFHQKRNWY
jgi:hypothetical protein